MNLYDLFSEITSIDFPDREVTGITDDSRNIKEGCVYVCVKGASFDGHSKAAEAISRGAAAVVTEYDTGTDRQIIVDDSRKCYGDLCAAWFGHPERKITAIGVTGTNGKTTMTNVIKHILTSNGHKTGLIGTIQNEIGDEVVHTENTTPMTYDYMSLLDRMVKEKCDYVVMEVSSFGLVQHRIGPTHFRVSVFTNLTQDHLDYHKDMEDYYQAKKKLFDVSDISVCNIDDEYGNRLYKEINTQKYSFSRKGKADFHADSIMLKSDGTFFDLSDRDKTYSISMKMTGTFNVENVSQAAAACMILGIPAEKIIPCISDYPGVKGRCEVIPTGRDFTVICDYAHTPDAITNILGSVREYCHGRLICLFGCGGNRDSKKRPLMARAAAELSDLIVITSDNPRNEDPEDIIDDVLKGIEDSSIKYIVEPDREKAIYKVLALAEKNDIIVLAGKGHEDYQVLRDNVHIHFDEREIVAQGLNLLK